MTKSNPHSSPPKIESSLARYSLVLALAAMLLAFAYSVELRSGSMGLMSETTGTSGHGGHQWLTASTVLWAGNWLEEGVGGGLRLYEAPDSVEYQTDRKRPEYFSYPPGAIVPAYLLSLVWGKATVAVVQTVGLAAQLAAACLLFAGVYRLARAHDYPPAACSLLALAAALVEILAPINLYYMQFVYCFDEAAIPLFAGALCLETFVRTTADPVIRKRWEGALLALLFYGYVTDWLLPIVGTMIFAARLIWPLENRGRFDWKWIALFWAPAALSAFLFFAHLTVFDGWDTLGSRFRERVGLAETTEVTFGELWSQRLPSRIAAGFGMGAFLVLPLGLAAWIWRIVQQRSQPSAAASVACAIGFVAFAAPLIQISVFWEHSSIHEFATLKLTIPLALSIGWFLPAAIVALIPEGRYVTQISAAAMIATLAALGSIHQRMVEYLPLGQPLLFQLQELAAEKNLGYDDLLISPDVEVAPTPPQRIALLRKQIYSPEDGRKIAADLAARGIPFRLRTVGWDGEHLTISAPTVADEDKPD